MVVHFIPELGRQSRCAYMVCKESSKPARAYIVRPCLKKGKKELKKKGEERKGGRKGGRREGREGRRKEASKQAG